METQKEVKGESKGPPSEMKGRSSEEVLIAPGLNEAIGFLKEPRPLPAIPWTHVTVVSTVRVDSSALGAQ